MKKIRLLFMGTPLFAVPSLLAFVTGNHSSHEVVAVVTQPDRPCGRGYQVAATAIKEQSEAKGLPVIQPVALNTGDFAEQVKELAPDLLVNVAYGRIIPLQILEIPPLGAINLHPSLLPLYRGAAPIQRAIMNGDAVTGNTVLYMAEELDAGNIIMQEEEAIHIDDTAGELGWRLAEKGAILLLKIVHQVAAGKVLSWPQDVSKITLAPSLDPEEERIDWQHSALEIHNKVRALNPQPGAYSVMGRRRLKIWKTSLDPAGEFSRTAKTKVPGTVLSRSESGVFVQTGDGILVLNEVQQEGKKRLPANEFWRGSCLFLGSRLGP